MAQLKVTIAGESAGSMSVIALYLSKAAKGLFHGAIAQSGVMNMPMLYQNEPSINHFRLVSYCNDIGTYLMLYLNFFTQSFYSL